MSRFLGNQAKKMTPYVPGEQPKDLTTCIKLNTNECPYPPSPQVKKVLEESRIEQLALYPDATAYELRKVMGEYVGLPPEWVFAGGGSDEVLAFCFMAFFDKGDKVYFPDVTYGFYKVYANLYELQAEEFALDMSFGIPLDYLKKVDGHIVLANPNAPTGIALSHREVEELLQSDPDRLVILDEAYADFSEEGSCVNLVEKYDNLLVVQTFSKSRALAGMRLGFAFGQPPLMESLERMKFTFNPFNLDWISMEVGKAAIKDTVNFQETVDKVIATREKSKKRLDDLGFYQLPSQTNFIFASHRKIKGKELYEKLKERNILVRHFSLKPVERFVRITIGTEKQMERLFTAIEEILKEG